MVKLKEESLAFGIMNTSRPQIPKGNKLFLPKIEYAKLTEGQSRFDGEKPNIKTATSESEKSNGEVEKSEKVPLLNSEYNMGTFTRFSVLPPIKDGVRNVRRMSRARKFSTGLYASANGPNRGSNYEQSNKQADDYRSHKYAGLSNAVARQRRDSNADNELVQSLQVIGKQYVRGKRQTRHSLGQGRGNARSPRRSFSSPNPSETGDSTCLGCQTVFTRRRSKTLDANLGEKFASQVDLRIIHTCNNKETRTGSVLRRFNSDNLELQKERRVLEQNNNNQASQSHEKASTLIYKPERTNLLTTDFSLGRRPVSRCEISVDMNEGVKDTVKQKNVAPPLIQIDRIETHHTTALAHEDEDTLNPQGTPQIQILIDSIDSAKEELPKPGREVPYTSVREQRRRSALCRNNSKQVDDFLLVHNLRDLGLL